MRTRFNLPNSVTLSLFVLMIISAKGLFGQSANCVTATPLTLNNGTVCVNGSNTGIPVTTYTGSGCPSGAVQIAWYTYNTNGSTNTFTVDPGTMTNAMILITFSCPNPTLIIETCNSGTGGANVSTTWGTTTGQQVYIGVASMGGVNGTFQLCVNSQPPAPGPGNTCSQAVPICTLPFVQSSIPSSSSGQNPNCFLSPPQQDVFIQFTVTQSGVLAWTATCPPATEYDWALWNISGGCPGTVACCNYNYAAGSGNGFGMQNQGGNAPCGTNALGTDNNEFSPTINVTCGQTYAIQISNYSNNNNGFTLNFTNSTAQISSNATFTVSPTLVCGSSLTAVINDGSTGDCAAVWNYGDGSATYTGGTPPNHTYTTPGTYAITETIGGACPSTVTHFVQLLAPLASTVTATNSGCTGCTGTASVTAVSGGNGIYTYSWSPGGQTTTTLSGLCPGTYTSIVTNTVCATSVTHTVTVTAPPMPTVTVNSPTICKNATVTLSASGATTYSWSPSTGLSATTGASVTANPTVTTTYTVVGTIGSCTASATAVVTVNPTPTITVNSPTICINASTTLNAGGASTYTWSPGTGLSGTTGASVTANPTVTTTYTITGTSALSCTATATSTVTVNPNPTVTVNSPSICVNGSTTLNAGGASTYSWSPGTGLSGTTGASVTANPTVTTIYTVTGTSAATCTSTATSTVTVNPTPTITVGSATMCPGNSTTLTASGANTYTWSPATGLSGTTGASVTASPTVTTTYTITGTSVAGCTATATSTVTIGGSIVPSVNSATICLGQQTATLTATGGATYTWTPSSSLSSSTGATVTANPTVTTTYTITAASGGCTGTTTAMVTVNPTPTLSVNSPSLCVGNSATVTASGANTYTWGPGTGLSSTTGASVTANPTVTTTYTITGTSVAGCTATATSTVTVNPVPTVTVNNATYCTGGSAVLTAGGASTYTWSPGTGLSSTTGASVTANPTVTTNYTVTGTSAAGCVNTATTSVTVVTNPTVTVNTATICINNSTTLTANGAVTYSWSPATGLSSTTGSSVTANPTSTTVYTITGTAGTCTAVATTTVTVNPLPVVTVNSGTICLGQQTATLTAGGASTYTWSPSTGLSSSTGSPVTANPSTTTSYTVTGTDANSCVNTATTAVTVNPIPTLTLTSGFICNGSSTTLTASGASTYTWSPGTGLSSTTGSSVTGNPPSTTQYTVTGTDANGCVDSDTTSITVVNNPTVTVASATICINSSTTLTANGAQTYVWTPGTGLSSTSGTSVTANPTSTTVYTITGTAGTCTAVTTATVTVNPLPVVTVDSGTICVGQQTATLTAGGASTYTWSPATGLCCTTGATVTGTPTTTTSYTVTGTDANGCVNTETTTITVNPLPIITVNSDLICVGGSTTLNAGGASTYVWSPGTGLSSTTGSSVTANPSSTTVYTVTGTDANGCYDSSVSTVTVVANPTVTVASATICINSSTTLNAGGASTYVWSPGTGLSSTTGSSVTANPTSTTVYTITGTAGTCTAVTTATVEVNPLPVVTASSNTPCVNQNLSLNATGGTSYSWSGPNSFSSSQQNPTVNGVTSADAGIYTVTVTDANTCVNTATVNVTINPLPVVVVTGATVCVNATINLTCNNSGVTFSWSGPNSFSSNQQNPSIPGATTNMSGGYVVTVTDANGCASGNVANVVVNPALAINATNNGPICENGTLVLATGAGVSWSWSGPNGFSSVSQTPTIPNALPNATGTYTVVGTDANGCTGTATTSAVVNPLPIVTVNSGTICVTQQIATLTAAGASTYSWSPASTLSSSTGSPVSANPMVTTIYTVTGVDANGCVNTNTSTVTVNQLPVVTVNSPVICFGNSATLTAGGASTYSWTPASDLSSSTGSPVTANPASTTSYTVTGVDANGCYNTGVSQVTVNPLPVISVNSGNICAGASTTLNATGANTYAWSPSTGLSSSTGASVLANPSGTSTYVVTGTDINGCSNTDTAVVTVNPLPVVTVGPQTASGCAPVCVNLANTSTVTGNCSWNFGDGSTSTACTPTHCYTGQGTFNAVLTLADGNGCVGTGSAVVTVYPVPNADFVFDPNPANVFESTIQFVDASSGAYVTNWGWTFGDPQNSSSTVQNPSFNYGDPGTYPVTLVVTSNYGCVDSVTKTVVIDPDFSIYVPNAFSPNFDGVNDVFMAKGEGIKEFQLYVFDRWGNQVFYSEDIYKGWDGRFQAKGEDIVQEDVYVWKIELKNFKNEPRQLKGTVSLIK